MTPEPRLIRVAHSPDSDDAFMFYALAQDPPLVDPGPFRFEHVLSDIQTLNEAALRGEYEVSAISIHALPYVADRYALLTSGASMGEKDYGPMVVAREPFASLRGKRIAVPGELTSAYLTLRLYEPDFEHVVHPFDRIMEVVQRGEADAGLIIHEGQLTYRQQGLHEIVNLGRWWHDETGLPLPLGGNVIRKDLGADADRVASILKSSIQYALDHRQEALSHAMRYAGDMSRELADEFVGWYVNERTVDYGEEGRRAVQLLIDRGYRAGVLKRHVTVEFVG